MRIGSSRPEMVAGGGKNEDRVRMSVKGASSSLDSSMGGVLQLYGLAVVAYSNLRSPLTMR